MPYDIIIGRDESDKKRFGKKGLIFLGKGYVTMGNYTSLSNLIWMDVARSHVVLVAGKRGCLSEEAMVFTDKGYKKIKEFDSKQDKVLSFDKEKKAFEWENAELLKYPVKNESLLRIEFENGKKLILTKEHPLMEVTGDKLLSLLWVKANSLRENGKVLSIGKSLNDLVPLSIKKISQINGIKEVYDLSVDKNHSFIANGIISHNSGKSYSIGVIAEELSSLPEEESKNIASLIFDTMGIFWTMKFKNEKEKELLDEWNLKPKNLPVKIFVPFGYVKAYEERGISFDETFSINPYEIKIEEWVSLFGLSIISPEAVVLEKAIFKLQEEKPEFFIKDIIEEIQNDKSSDEKTKNSASSLFSAAITWGVFSDEKHRGIKIEDIVEAGRTSIIDLSCYSSIGAFNVRALVIGLLTRKLFDQRMLARKREEVTAVRHGIDYLAYSEQREMPLVWIFLDESHEFLPREGKTAATDALIQVLREGRQPGISIVLATQQPGQIHTDVMTQSDIIISHRVTSRPDVTALNNIMQTYLLESIQRSMDELPSLKGSAIILDDNSERIYPMRIRPRFTWHGGEAPTAVKVEKRI